MTHAIVDFPGAYATGEVIDRKDILDEIKNRIDETGRSYVIYITGLGGMGKTFLLREVLKRCRPGGEWYNPELNLATATEVVDLYHAQTHSIEGLTENIRQVLSASPSQPDMSRYNAELNNFKQKRFHFAGMLREVSTLREHVAEMFMDDINANSGNRRLVLALDTAERLLYEPDNIQKLLALETEGVDARPWLIEKFLPQIENAVILIGGRPQPKKLRDDLEKHIPADRLKQRGISGFEEGKYVSEYLEAVAKQLETTQPQMAARVRGIPEDTRQVIFRYTEGRPIFLSLLIDYLAVAGELLPEVRVSAEEAGKKSEVALGQIRDKLEAELMRRLQNTGRLTDEVVRILSVARKGLDKEMLARISGLNEARVAEVVEMLKKLSFVKIRPSDERLFLHDEMYEMFQRHIRLPGMQRRGIYKCILADYEEAIPSVRKELADLLEKRSNRFKTGSLTNTGAGGTSGDAEKIAKLNETLFTLIIEEVYYRFRSEPEAGFRAYRTYRKEMYWANADDADMQLHMEVIAFLEEPENVGKADFGQVSREEIELELAFSWVDRYKKRAKYEQALNVINGLWEKQNDLLKAGGYFAEARLKALEGEIIAYLGTNLQHARDLLQKSSSLLKDFTPKDEFETWEQNQLLADTLNTFGYLYRVIGRYQLSIDAYQQAQQYWDKVVEGSKEQTIKHAMRAQKANTTNNLGLPLALLGRYQDAQRQCRDGYTMRMELGPLAPVAFSLNTLGMIRMRDDHPREAEDFCRRALRLFVDFEQTRGIGLASIALAEALRRRSWAATDSNPIFERAGWLKEAQGYCTKAIRIFDLKTGEVKERPQMLEALIEQGCTFRDWCDLRDSYEANEEEHPDRNSLFHGAETALKQAIEVGETEADLAHKVADARINLAWLYFSANKYTQANEEIIQAQKNIPPQYLKLDQSVPEEETPQTFFWVQLGKAHLLLGLIALKAFHQDEKNLEPLKIVGRHLTLSLAYDERFAGDFRDMRRGKDRIYESLKGLKRLREFPVILKAAQATAEKYDLAQPPAFYKFLIESFGQSTENL